MPSFRGIDSAEIVDSLHRAERYLDKCNLGPLTRDILKAWRVDGMPHILHDAQDDKEMVTFLSLSGTLKLMHRFQDLFELAARIEITDGYETEVQDICRDLMAWNAFLDASVKPGPGLQKEIRDHLIVEMMKRLFARGDHLRDEALDRLPLAAIDLAREDKMAAEWIDESLPVMALLYQQNDFSFVKQWIQRESEDVKKYLDAVLREMSALPETAQVLNYPQAMNIYGIAVHAQEPGDTREEQALALHFTLKRRLDEIAADFFPIREIENISTGEITPAGHYGIRFIATARVAEAVAQALPGYTVINHRGDVIKSAPLNPPRLLGPAP